MGRGVGVTISGLESVIAALGAKGELTRLGTIDGINHTALDVQRDAKRAAPVDTGRLRSSIAMDPATAAEPEARVETNVEYAPHLEYGTTNQPAQPYMTPAMERNLPRHADNIDQAIKRRLGA
jgi:HK97 gp10 family phage protein